MLRNDRVLLLTVGTGTADQLRATVLEPFAKSIQAGEWTRVILFPSKLTEANAQAVAAEHAGLPVEIRALRRPGDEESVDACFAHFDLEISRLTAEGCAPARMTADFTRGTKALSAALALAAAAHGVGSLRYIGATKRDERGMAVPGCERMSDLVPEAIWERQRLVLGVSYLEAGDFRAAGRLFPGWPRAAWAGPRAYEIQWLNWAARFWGAWDAFDYKSAHKLSGLSGMPSRKPAWASRFLPSEDQKSFLAGLAAQDLEDPVAKADRCRNLGADLLANAVRRLGEGQTEEVLVRLYRVLELIGQTRLFAAGLDSADLDRGHPAVQKWLAGLPDAPVSNRNGKLEIGREKVASLLQVLGDPSAAKLLDVSWLGDFGPVMRNKSILIHGFKSRTRNREKELSELIGKLEAFYAAEDAANPGRLSSARFAFLA